MTTVMTCESFADRLADYLERDTDEPTRLLMDAHAVTCDACGLLLADLRELGAEAAALPQLAPSRDLWAGVAARIDAPVISIGTRAGVTVASTRGGSSWRRWTGAAAAAVLLVALTSATTYYLTVRGNEGSGASAPLASSSAAPSAPTVAQLAPPVAPSGTTDSMVGSGASRAVSAGIDVRIPARVVSNKRSAEVVYDQEISRLKAIVARRNPQLDPVTVGVIQRNLKVIDDAIAQCRLALVKDPASRFLMQSLNNALESKVELLRTAATLPSRT